MRHNSYSYTQEARNDELGMLQFSSVANNDFDAKEAHRDYQFDKMFDALIESAYEEMER